MSLRPLLLITSLVLLLSGCSNANDYWKDAGSKKRVVATTVPLYCLTRAVGGDDAQVLCLRPTGVHELAEDHADLLKLRRAEIIFANGLELDEDLVRKEMLSSGNRSGRLVLVGDELPDSMKLHMREEHEEHEKGAKHDEHEHHHHGDHDPHIWLGPPQAVAMVRIIAGELSKADPAHKDGYDKRAAACIGEIEKLEQHGKDKLEGKNNRIITMHESLGYFAHAFGLDVVDSLQAQAGSDPDSARLAVIAKKCKDKDVHVVTVEPQYSRVLAEALKRHLKGAGQTVRLVEIDPIETAPAVHEGNPDPRYYFTKLRANIDNLAEALQ